MSRNAAVIILLQHYLRYHRCYADFVKVFEATFLDIGRDLDNAETDEDKDYMVTDQEKEKETRLFERRTPTCTSLPTCGLLSLKRMFVPHLRLGICLPAVSKRGNWSFASMKMASDRLVTPKTRNC